MLLALLKDKNSSTPQFQVNPDEPMVIKKSKQVHVETGRSRDPEPVLSKIGGKSQKSNNSEDAASDK